MREGGRERGEGGAVSNDFFFLFCFCVWFFCVCGFVVGVGVLSEREGTVRRKEIRYMAT